jgi:hypothetical protein
MAARQVRSTFGRRIVALRRRWARWVWRCSRWLAAVATRLDPSGAPVRLSPVDSLAEDVTTAASPDAAGSAGAGADDPESTGPGAEAGTRWGGRSGPAPEHWLSEVRRRAPSLLSDPAPGRPPVAHRRGGYGHPPAPSHPARPAPAGAWPAARDGDVLTRWPAEPDRGRWPRVPDAPDPAGTASSAAAGTESAAAAGTAGPGTGGHAAATPAPWGPAARPVPQPWPHRRTAPYPRDWPEAGGGARVRVTFGREAVRTWPALPDDAPLWSVDFTVDEAETGDETEHHARLDREQKGRPWNG